MNACTLNRTKYVCATLKKKSAPICSHALSENISACSQGVIVIDNKKKVSSTFFFSRSFPPLPRALPSLNKQDKPRHQKGKHGIQY